MATTPKTGSTTPKRGRRPSKPATIDLAAKDVSKTQPAPKSDAAKVDTKTQNFGRDAASNKTTASKTSPKAATGSSDKDSGASSEKKEATSAAPAKPSVPNTKPEQKQAKSGSSVMSGLVGACLAVVGLGAVGQYEGASQIPLIGSIFAGSAGSNAGGQSTEQIDLLNARIDELAANNTAPAADNSDEIAALNQKIIDLEANISATNDSGDDSRIADLEQDVSRFSTVLADLSGAVSEGGNPEIALAAANAKITELGQKIAGLTPPDLTPIQDSITAVEGDLAALREEISKNAGNIGSINDLAGKLDTEINSIRVSSKVAKSVAVNALGTALQNDDPLAIPVSSIEALVGQTEETVRLNELVREGVPTIKALDAELDAIADSVQNPVTETQTDSITDKLWANARSLVTVRTSGPREGDSASAILSRIKSNLNNRDLDGVQAEWTKLPPDVSANNNDWIAKVEARAEAFVLYQKISDNLSNPAG